MTEAEIISLQWHDRDEHDAADRLECPECGSEQRRNELETHRRIMHHPNCPRCQRPLTKSPDEHVTGICQIHGDVCIPKVTPETALAESSNGRAAARGPQSYKRALVKCQQCGREMSGAQALASHMRGTHAGMAVAR